MKQDGRKDEGRKEGEWGRWRKHDDLLSNNPQSIHKASGMFCFLAGLELSLQIPTIWQSVSSTYSLAFLFTQGH